MAILLGLDTGGTYTDAVLLDDATDRVVASAKSLTSRPDLSIGIAGAVDAVLASGQAKAGDIALVSLSTTLATNALVEGQGGKVALVFIGFAAAELARDGLEEALSGDPVITLGGGHSHGGDEVAPLDLATLDAALNDLGDVTGFAVAAQFATRNPAHELAARDLIRRRTGRPVTCSHELSRALGGPKRALTAVLNARLIGMIDRLILACEGHLAGRGITAPLMVVRGDGALISAAVARDKPIETILSGPAASVAGAAWLTGEQTALVSDIGGTTTDVCLLQDGKPAIDAHGARVGRYRTMVEAVAMRTAGLGGDSEVHVDAGLAGELRLGPRRLMPLSLLARQAPDMVHRALDQALARPHTSEADGQFVVPIWHSAPEGLDRREAAVAARLAQGPLPLAEAAPQRTELPAVQRLVARGYVLLSGVTPSDASHQLGHATDWDTGAAAKGLTLMARRRNGAGQPLAPNAETLARAITDQLTRQTTRCLLETAFAEDGGWGGEDPGVLADHPLTRAGLAGHRGAVAVSVALGVPVIGLGASAGTYYPAVGEAVGSRMILPRHADVANAVGAVVGQVRVAVRGTITSGGEGQFTAHIAQDPQRFTDRASAFAAMEEALEAEVQSKAIAAGIGAYRITKTEEIREAEIEGMPMFIEAELTVAAEGRPRIATDEVTAAGQ